jgi:hypothetical protein
MTEIRLNTFKELVNFMKRQDVTIEQVAEIIYQGYKIIVFVENFKSKDEIIETFCEVYEKYKNTKEKPIFMGVDISVRD